MDVEKTGDGKEELPVVPDDFDLEQYISQYTKYTRVRRLTFVASKTQGLEVEKEALALAMAALTQTSNTALYTEVAEKLSALKGEELVDQKWVEQVGLHCFRG